MSEAATTKPLDWAPKLAALAALIDACTDSKNGVPARDVFLTRVSDKAAGVAQTILDELPNTQYQAKPKVGDAKS